jgi:putative FmdB family regulatory protein
MEDELMPRYEYVCTDCNHKFADIVPIADRDNVYCPECENVARRGVAAPSVHFKGSGWTQKKSHNTKPKSIETTTRDLSDKWKTDHPNN